MRRLFLLLIMCIACPLCVMAQGKMAVKSFRVLENDQDARVAYKREDNNGRLAALIKVQTKEKGFNFSTGVTGIVGDVVYKPGEVWVYVPRRSMKITISHPDFGIMRDYEFPVPIDGGTVYELVLDPGIGKFINVSASEPNARISLDNDSIGITNVVQQYVLYGHHRLTAKLGYFEGEMEIDVTESSPDSYLIQMKNVQNQFHHVTVMTDNGVLILRDGRVIGSGSWEGTLREGTYFFYTHKENYEDAETIINVGSGNRNIFTLNKPKPVYGFLKLAVTPVRAVVTTTDNRSLNHRNVIELPVGRHYLTFKAAGYYEKKDVQFDIAANKTTEHTINLEPIDYVKQTSFYIGGGVSYASFAGISATAGVTLFNVDLQLTYSLGMTTTDDLSWYETSTNNFYSKMNYKMNTFAARLGYQIHLTNRLAIIPQFGFYAQSLVGNTIEGTGLLGDGASASGFTIGAKMVVVPAHHFGVFVMPEFGIPGKETDAFKAIAEKANFNTGGIMATGGLFFNF